MKKRSSKNISTFLLSAMMLAICTPSFIANATQMKDELAGEKENASLDETLTIVDKDDMGNFGVIKNDGPTEIPTVKGGRSNIGTYARTPDESGYFAPPLTSAGEVFGGWYEDTKYTQPVGKDVVEVKGFLRWVKVGVMDVRAQVTKGTTANSESTDMRIVSTVDTLAYRDAGFFITVSKTTRISCRTVYTGLKGSDGNSIIEYSPTDFNKYSVYFTTYTINNIPKEKFGTDIKITPYWVTLDGTMVKGPEVSKTVNDCLNVK